MRDPVLSCRTSTASIQCNDSFPEELNLSKQTCATSYVSDQYPRLVRSRTLGARMNHIWWSKDHTRTPPAPSGSSMFSRRRRVDITMTQHSSTHLCGRAYITCVVSTSRNQHQATNVCNRICAFNSLLSVSLLHRATLSSCLPLAVTTSSTAQTSPTRVRHSRRPTKLWTGRPSQSVIFTSNTCKILPM